jgi:hypothetical protein
VAEHCPPLPPWPLYVLPALFDERIDKEHRSYMSAICGADPGTLRARVLSHYMPLHPTWVPKYVIPYLIKFNIHSLIFLFIFHCTDTYYIVWSRLRRLGLDAVDDSSARPPLAVRVRLPPRLCTSGPVAPRDAHVPFPLGR